MAQVALKKAEKQLAQHDTDELKAQVAELRSAAEAAQKALEAAQASAPAPTAAAPANDDALKKAKIEAAMLKAQLRKLEKLEAPSAEQQAELEQTRAKLVEAEKALEQLQSAAPAPAAPANDDSLKKAKIEAAMLKAQLRKLEKLEAPSAEQQAELEQTRTKLVEAEKTLEQLQSAAPAPAAKAIDDSELKKAKVELAMKRAELKKAEKAGAEESELERLRQALSVAEQALHAAEDASGKPAPELVRTEQPGVDAELKALKTEVAFARADLRKLERDDTTASDTLEAARARLATAEQALAAHQA